MTVWFRDLSPAQRASVDQVYQETKDVVDRLLCQVLVLEGDPAIESINLAHECVVEEVARLAGTTGTGDQLGAAIAICGELLRRALLERAGSAEDVRDYQDAARRAERA